ncbi:MAG: HEAT repeat domain-containing protein [Myxococcaceae bacterium]|nr:HEAT repeat domain-containing protein [Myxococcaceae bacterium]
MARLYSRLLAVVPVLLLGACRDSAFNAASKAGTPEALRLYLAQHPEDEQVPAAQAQLEEKVFAQAREAHSVVGYKRFLEEFPEGAHAPSARALLEALRFNAAKDKGTATAWRQFLEDHPQGAKAAQARDTLRALELKQVLTPDADAAALARAAETADDVAGAPLRERLDAQTFKEAQGPRAWFDYLRRFPAGKFRDEAKAGLLNAQLEGLLVSGQIDAATDLVKRSPLASGLKGAAARLSHETEMLKLLQVKEPAVQRALPQFYRRSFEDLKDALGSSDARDRWDAAVELGHHVDVRAIDALLEVLKTNRNDKVRRHAAESLRQVLTLLPPQAAEYEVFSRIEAGRDTSKDSKVIIANGLLLEGLNLVDDARLEYQKAFEPRLLDPVLLARGAQMRLARNENYSAVVAARLLAVWAQETIDENLEPDDLSVSATRQVCAAADASRQAAQIFAQVRGKPTEFQKDIEQFERQAMASRALVEARLRDMELKVMEKDASFRPCFAEGAAERLAVADQKRLEAFKKLTPQWSGKVRAYALLRDPSPQVRAAAQASPASATGQ